MSPLRTASTSKFMLPPSPSSPASGANIRPISLREMFCAEPLALRVIAARSASASRFTLAAGVLRLTPSTANTPESSNLNGSRNVNGTSITLARGSETTPEALRDSPSVLAKNLPSSRPETLTPKSGANFMSSSRDIAVRKRFAVIGSSLPVNFPVPFSPMFSFDVSTSRGSKFRRAVALRGNVLSSETNREDSKKFPVSSSIRASSDRAA